MTYYATRSRCDPRRFMEIQRMTREELIEALINAEAERDQAEAHHRGCSKLGECGRDHVHQDRT